MSFRRKNPNLLIVEGHDDKHSVIGLMKSHVEWPADIEKCPVFIEVGLSVEEILNPAHLRVQMKEPNLQALGIMIDADTKPASRYQSLLKTCSGEFPAMPQTIDAGGLVVENSDGKRLGIWIMPDNSSEGCLETFLRYLVPDESESLWAHATESVASSRHRGATYRDAHAPKANLYTWLAWQDPPGQSPGMALTRKILYPHSQTGIPFIKWFRELYQLQTKSS